MKDRVGTDRDADALVKLFLYLGFYTNRYDDLKGTEMRRRLQVRRVSSLLVFSLFTLLVLTACFLSILLAVSSLRMWLTLTILSLTV